MTGSLSMIVKSSAAALQHMHHAMAAHRHGAYAGLFPYGMGLDYWASFDLWISGWMQHYRSLVASYIQEIDCRWMLQVVPIYYYWQCFIRLQAQIDAHGCQAKLQAHYPNAWSIACDDVLVLTGQVATYIEQYQSRANPTIQSAFSRLNAQLFKTLVRALAMMITVLCERVHKKGQALVFQALEKALMHPAYGDQLMMRLVCGAEQEDEGILASSGKGSRWLRYLHWALFATVVVIFLYHSVLFGIYYPKRLDVYLWWMFGSGIALVALIAERLWHWFVSKREVHAKVDRFVHWVHHEVQPVSGDHYISSPDLDAPAAMLIDGSPQTQLTPSTSQLALWVD